MNVEVDTLSLVGAPINQSLLNELEARVASGIIKNLIIRNLTEFGDPIFAGMNDANIVGVAPTLMSQMSAADSSGHFYYTGAGSEASPMRKRQLIAEMIERGLE